MRFSTSIFIMLILAGCSLVAKDPLEGTAWTLVSLAGSPPVEGSVVTIKFSDGQASGSTGCNAYSGTYELKRSKIELSDLMSTLMACVDERVMEQEQKFTGYLQDAESFEVNDAELKLITIKGVELMFAPTK